jgi:hypothetical protein
VAFSDIQLHCKPLASLVRSQIGQITCMNLFPDPGTAHSQSGDESLLRRVLHSRLHGKLSDNEFVAAVRGNCTESEFMDAISAQLASEPQSLRTVIALVNRLRHRGDISTDLMHLIKSRISPVPEPVLPVKKVDDLRSTQDVNLVPVSVRRLPAARPSAIFSVLISVAAVSVLFVRLAPGGRVNSEALSTAAMNAPAAAVAQSDESPGASAPNSVTSATSAPSSPATHGATIPSGDYQVQPGQHFAEIRVHRPAHARNDALTWWTEPATAKPGVDYVNQTKVSQSFPRGRDSMSVFVKLLPGARRRQPGVFYIAVADRDMSDPRVGRVTHTAVRLPSNRTPL